MRQKSFRFRRWAAATLGAVTAVSGVAVLGAGTAQAVTTTTTVVASSQPTIRAGVANQAAGNETITIQPSYTWVNTDAITLTVKDSGGTAVNFTTTPTVTVTSETGNTPPTVTTSGGAGTNAVTITFTNSGTANVAQPIVLSNIAYSPSGTAASGAVAVTASATGTGTGSGAGAVFSVASASNATIVGGFTSFGLNAVTQPVVGAGQNNQAAGNLSLGFSGSAGSGWFAGDKITLLVAPHAQANCTGTLASPITLGYASTPTATVTNTAGDVSTPMTISSVTLAQSTACAGTTTNDEVILTLGNSGTLTGTPAALTNPPTAATQPITITLSGVAYNVSAAITVGSVSMGELYNGVSAVASSTVGLPTGPSNATVNTVNVTANNPAVGVATNSINQPISNVVIAESQAAIVPTGYVCVTLSPASVADGAAFNTSTATPVATASGGGAAVGSTVTATSTTLEYTVTTPSTTTPATYTLSNINANASNAAGPVTASVVDGATAACTGGTTLSGVNGLTLFSVVGSNRIYGQIQDATAAAELATAFPPATGTCPGGAAVGVPRPVVLATDQNFPDALSASYLAKQLDTGTLVTPTNGVSSDTLNALRQEGITQVFVVGGPIAISAADVSQLQGTQSYHCGGLSGRTTALGGPQDLTVTQIYGQTQYGTAQQVAEYAGANGVGSASFVGAYPASSSATGMYNDTTGLSGTAATGVSGGPLKTAILATGTNYPDAMAASVMAYNKKWPVLLTQQGSLAPEAQAAIVNLGIQQVVVMGGPIAISDAVVTQLEGMGVSVLRIAGQDYTDTAQLLAQFELNAQSNTAGQAEGLGWVPTTLPNHVAFGTLGLLVSRGDFYTDALAGSVLGAAMSPILLTENPSTIGTYLTSFLNAYGNPNGLFHADPQVLTLLGGPLAITPATASGMQTALG